MAAQARPARTFAAPAGNAECARRLALAVPIGRERGFTADRIGSRMKLADAKEQTRPPEAPVPGSLSGPAALRFWTAVIVTGVTRDSAGRD